MKRKKERQTMHCTVQRAILLFSFVRSSFAFSNRMKKEEEEEELK